MTPPVPGNWGMQFSQHAAPVNASPFNQQAAQRNGPINVHQLGWGVQFMGDQKAMHSKSESLRRFSGQPTDFSTWARHMIDHMAMVHPHWRQTLEWLATSEENLSFNRLASEIVGPYDEAASELAVKFEQVQVNFLPERLYLRRKQLSGGVGNHGNGFMMWRRLHRNCVGSGEIHDYVGTHKFSVNTVAAISCTR